MKRAVTLLAAASLLGVATSALAQEPAAATGERLSQDEVIYFVLPDRFANGDPNNERIPQWKPYSPPERTTLIFDEDLRVESDPRASFRQYWKP